MNKNVLYRSIPKVDVLLETESIQELIQRYGRETVMEAIHEETEGLRVRIGSCKDEETEEVRQEILRLPERVFCSVERMHIPNMRP